MTSTPPSLIRHPLDKSTFRAETFPIETAVPGVVCSPNRLHFIKLQLYPTVAFILTCFRCARDFTCTRPLKRLFLIAVENGKSEFFPTAEILASLHSRAITMAAISQIRDCRCDQTRTGSIKCQGIWESDGRVRPIRVFFLFFSM